MKRTIHPLLPLAIAVALLGFAACKKQATIIVERVGLVEKPGAKQPVYVPNALLQRAEVVKILEEKDVDGTKYYLVQPEGTEKKGWLEARWVKQGKLESVTVVRDSDIFQRPNEKSAKVPARARAGQVAFKISTSGDFVEIMYGGVEGFVKKSNVGDGTMVVRSIAIPGLGTATISASSQYTAAEGREAEFDPRNLFDGSLQTAWCEGKPGDDDGVGESVTLNFEAPVTLSKVEVVNGWGKSEASYEENNRVSALKIRGDYGNATVQLQDKTYDYQSGDVGVSGMTFQFVIDGVHKGRDRDTCISEIRLTGSAMPGNPGMH